MKRSSRIAALGLIAAGSLSASAKADLFTLDFFDFLNGQVINFPGDTTPTTGADYNVIEIPADYLSPFWDVDGTALDVVFGAIEASGQAGFAIAFDTTAGVNNNDDDQWAPFFNDESNADSLAEIEAFFATYPQFKASSGGPTALDPRNILIVQETKNTTGGVSQADGCVDGICTIPDDEGGGANMQIFFSQPADFAGAVLTDADETTVFTFYGVDGNTFSQTLQDQGAGRNQWRIIDGITAEKLTQIDIQSSNSWGIAQLAFNFDCEDYNACEPDDTPPPSVPEPATAGLLALGVLGSLGVIRRRRRA
ncbi:MAG: PEP-CTERM sorting domain-containing protein [Geminicoccaceae bacterium]